MRWGAGARLTAPESVIKNLPWTLSPGPCKERRSSQTQSSDANASDLLQERSALEMRVRLGRFIMAFLVMTMPAEGFTRWSSALLVYAATQTVIAEYLYSIVRNFSITLGNSGL